MPISTHKRKRLKSSNAINKNKSDLSASENTTFNGNTSGHFVLPSPRHPKVRKSKSDGDLFKPKQLPKKPTEIIRIGPNPQIVIECGTSKYFSFSLQRKII